MGQDGPNQPSAKKAQANRLASLTKIVGVCFPFPAALRVQGRLLKEGFVNVKQVVIGPDLQRAGIVIFDECAGFANFVS